MYLKLTNKQINGPLVFIPFLELNDIYKDYLNSKFVNVDLHDAHVLCKYDNDSLVILGYLILNNTHMINSRLFETLRQNTINLGGNDPLPDVKNKRCKHLSDWVFDVQLSNRKDIGDIFYFITSIIQELPCILWCEIGDELHYCRIENEILGQTRAIAYFITNFPYL